MSGAVLSLIGAGGGASAVTITLSAQYIYAFNALGTASAAYQLKSDGTANYSQNGGGYIFLEDWCVPGAQATNYECYVTVVSGVLDGSSSATGTWLALSSSRAWLVSQPTLGITDAIINIGIRRVGTSTILASADITLQAEYN
jgi:hypothetical protein